VNTALRVSDPFANRVRQLAGESTRGNPANKVDDIPKRVGAGRANPVGDVTGGIRF
jgi:hypothetical protein